MAAYPNTRAFIEALEKRGELRRVRAPVSPVLEITEVADRVSKSRAPSEPSASAKRNDPRFWGYGGAALLFENVEGSDFPILINAYGSYRRTELALGCPDGFDALAARIGDLVKPARPRGLLEAAAIARRYAPLLRIGPRRVKAGPCHEVVKVGAEIDLTRLPLLRCWPLDGDPPAVGYPSGVNDAVVGTGHPDLSPEEWEARFRGRYVTFAGIHTIHADDAGQRRPSSHNIGMYRVQLVGKDRLAMHWHVHHDGAAHWRSWKRRGEPMPVAIAFGGEAVLPYAATAPLPPGVSELLMAGFLHGRGIRMVRARTVPLWVPASSDIVIEGWVRTDAGEPGWEPGDGPLGDGSFFEGPFGDHTGFYSMPDRYPIVEVSAVTHRRDAVFPATIVGLPPQEDYYLGKATERVFLPLLRTLIPDIGDYDLPMFGAFHNAVFAKIAKSYPMQARRVMHAVWGAGQMAWTKNLFIVDDDVDVHDAGAVLRAASSRCRPEHDVERVRGPLDILDHAAPALGAGTKLGFDCTRKWAGEEGGAALTGEWTVPPRDEIDAYLEQVRAVPGVEDTVWPEELGGWLFVRCSGVGRHVIADVWRVEVEHPAPFMVVVNEAVDLNDADAVMFRWCSNCDGGRDAMWGHGRVAFDATAKTRNADGEPVRAWPPVLEMSEDVRARVTQRWSEYGLDSKSG